MSEEGYNISETYIAYLATEIFGKEAVTIRSCYSIGEITGHRAIVWIEGPRTMGNSETERTLLQKTGISVIEAKKALKEELLDKLYEKMQKEKTHNKGDIS